VRGTEQIGRSGLRVRVLLDDGTAIEVALEAWLRSGVRAGDALDAQERARLEHDDLRSKVRDAALNLLAQRPRGREELRRRLAGKGFAGSAVEACLVALESERLIDDGAFARSFVRDRLRLRPRGRRRLSQELREKGLDAETVDEAVSDVFSDQQVDDEALARDAALGWLARQGQEGRAALARTDRCPERERAARRLGGYLARRGFGGTAARAAVDAAAEAAREREPGPL